MTTSITRPGLTGSAIEMFVRSWHQQLATAAPVEQLLPQLANGLRVELPDRILRGQGEFRRWYAAGAHAPLDDTRLADAAFDITVKSPVHAQVCVDLPGTDHLPAVRLEWWLVRTGGSLRVRTVTVTADAPATPQAAPEPEFAHL
ncbi:hypothetical protein [Streptomyces sp. NPDC059009]|uniref:hypothetical protein n=1 Tax=Streptomyces sp. NPDC059009 TaxID=3346694 RepID=UPI0036B76FCC